MYMNILKIMLYK